MLTDTLQTILRPEPAIPVSWELADRLGIRSTDRRFDIETRGPWQIAVRLCAPVAASYFDRSKPYTVTRGFSLLSDCGTMTDPRQSGYDMEGRVSVAGKKVSAFTSSQLFRLPDGSLRDCAIIFARLR